MPAVIRFDAVIVVVVVIIVIIQGLDILCCGHRNLSRCAVSSLSLRHRLYRHAAANIVAPTPVSLRLSRASGWLLHRHLSRKLYSFIFSQSCCYYPQQHPVSAAT